MSNEQNFINFLQSEGFEIVGAFREYHGGAWPRLKYQGEKKASGRYAYTQKGDIAFATFGSEKTGQEFKIWRSWDGDRLSIKELRERKEWQEAVKRRWEEKESIRQSKLANKLTKIYKKLPVAQQSFKYLKDKNVTSHKILKKRAKNNTLIVPVLDIDGYVNSIQYINSKGDKWFFTGGKVKGGFCPLTLDGAGWDKFFICEGLSTALSVQEATGLNVICAFNAGNMVNVAEIFRAKYQNANIIICADNDCYPSDNWPKRKAWVNTGVTKGTQAAGFIGAAMIYPQFTDDMNDIRPTDFNDYHNIYGVEKLKAYIDNALSKDIKKIDTERKTDAFVPSGLIDPEIEEKWFSIQDRLKFKGGVAGYYDEKHSVHNAILILSYHLTLAGTFVYDLFSHSNTIVKPLPWDDPVNFKWRPIEDIDLTRLRAFLNANFNTKISSKSEMSDVLDVVCNNKSIHPVRDYFDGLVWDGVDRLDNWIIDYCNPLSGHEEYLKKVSSCFLMAAVKRIYNPGEFHKQMLVLEGQQDIGKSTLLKNLATFNGIAYFSDNIGFKDITNPYLCSHLAGRLILEFPELKGLHAQDRNIIKAFISRTVDEMQPKYGMGVKKYPRQFVLAATTNDASWMNDPTGGIRFWPVHCGKIEFEAINQVKEQLWAEAVHRVKLGLPHWIKDTDPVYDLMKSEQSLRFEGHIWLEPIREYMRGKIYADVNDIVKNALHIPPERWSNSVNAKVSDCLRELGYINKPVWCRITKKMTRKWINIDNQPQEVFEEEVIF